MIGVSVIIPTFNRAETLVRAIESVLNQTYKDLEIIIIDDGSLDNTKELCSSYPVRYFYQENRGVSSARNLGIKNAKYDWIALLDSDDEWLSDKLMAQVDFLKNNPKFKLIHTEEIWIRSGVRVNIPKKYKKGGGDQFLNSLKLCAISPSTSLIHLDLLKEFNYFREDYPCCEDYDLWLKITSQNKVGFIDRPLIRKYAGHADQLSYQYIAMDYWRIKSMFDLLQNHRLDNNQKEELIKVLRKRCKILINGYKKHNNLKDLEEIQQIYNLSYIS